MNALLTGATEKNPSNPWLVALVVSLATFMEVLDTTITNVSLSHIAGTLGASQDESTWVLTSYLVANGIVLPLSGWLSDRIGRKPYFLLCIGAFTFASFACGAATSLGMLIVFRLIQGLAGGGLQPTQQAIILDAFPPEKRASVFAITSITMIFAPILGPTLGGVITDHFSWRWIFFINIPVGIIAMLLVNLHVLDPVSAKAKNSGKIASKIDGIGIGLVALGIGALQIMLDKGQQDDWFSSAFITANACICAASLAGAVFWLLRQKGPDADPVIDLHLFKYRSFAVACMLIFFTGFALYSGTTLLPLLLQSQFGYDATLAGLVLSPGGMFILFLMPVSAKLVGKVQAKFLIFIGMLLVGGGMLATSFLNPQTDYIHFVIVRILQVLGLPLLFIPISSMAFRDIPKAKNNKASALFSLARNIGGSVGIAVATSLVTRFEQTNQTNLAAHLMPGMQGYEESFNLFKQRFLDMGQSMAQALQNATGKMQAELMHQVTVMSYLDVFRVMAFVTFGLSLLAFFMPSNKPAQKPAADAPAAH